MTVMTSTPTARTMPRAPPGLSRPMHLVQLPLPPYDNRGNRINKSLFAQVRDELVERAKTRAGLAADLPLRRDLE